MRTIAHYMTKQPWSVQVDDSVAVARQMLVERQIHHLPVLDGGKLFGMVTERDIVRPHHGDATTVEAVATRVEEVDANTAFGDALELMAERGCDAVVVTRGGSVEGIFTAMDAVRVLRDRMRSRQRRPDVHGRVVTGR